MGESERPRILFGTDDPRLVLGLVALTVAIGAVDAACYLGFGHVFVANMTGNVVFLGFSVNPHSGISPTLSLVAFVAYCLGAFAAGRANHRLRIEPYVLIGVASVGAIVVTTIRFTLGESHAVQMVCVFILALGLGGMAHAVRSLGLPGLSVTVLTMATTGLFGDRPNRVVTARQVASIVAMVVGAALGALCEQISTGAALVIASILLIVATSWIATGQRRA